MEQRKVKIIKISQSISKYLKEIGLMVTTWEIPNLEKIFDDHETILS